MHPQEITMSATQPRQPILPGERAPDFALPAVDGTGTVSLAEYRGSSAVFLGLLIGLWCPFCRRAIAQMAANEPKLKAVDVETIGVVATRPENAQLYFKFRPSRLRLGADPELSTHRAYGLPKPVPTPEFMNALQTVEINPEGALPEPLPIAQAAATIGKLDGYEENEIDRADMERQWPQLKGQFLIDRAGVVRWANIEGAEGLAGIGRFPSAEQILTAARSL
jgi:peroxiredoxin